MALLAQTVGAIFDKLRTASSQAPALVKARGTLGLLALPRQPRFYLLVFQLIARARARTPAGVRRGTPSLQVGRDGSCGAKLSARCCVMRRGAPLLQVCRDGMECDVLSEEWRNFETASAHLTRVFPCAMPVIDGRVLDWRLFQLAAGYNLIVRAGPVGREGVPEVANLRGGVS